MRINSDITHLVLVHGSVQRYGQRQDDLRPGQVLHLLAGAALEPLLHLELEAVAGIPLVLGVPLQQREHVQQELLHVLLAFRREFRVAPAHQRLEHCGAYAGRVGVDGGVGRRGHGVFAR